MLTSIPKGHTITPIAPLDLSLDLEASSCAFCDAIKAFWGKYKKECFNVEANKVEELNLRKIGKIPI